MIDVSKKRTTLRIARAQATLKLSPETVQMIHDKKIPKGDPLECAKVTAMQAAKNTSRIIPFCHPMPVEFVKVSYEVQSNRIITEVLVKSIYRTGVEMEALTGTSVMIRLLCTS